jgi:isoleucyl-tRNA synthetase
MARAIKDIFADINTKGFQVKRKAGWDTHGLPVELGTERIRYYKRRYRKVYFHRRI